MPCSVAHHLSDFGHMHLLFEHEFPFLSNGDQDISHGFPKESDVSFSLEAQDQWKGPDVLHSHYMARWSRASPLKPGFKPWLCHLLRASQLQSRLAPVPQFLCLKTDLKQIFHDAIMKIKLHNSCTILDSA